MMLKPCYKCGQMHQGHNLSPRSRCADCEYQSNLFNEAENDNLRAALESQKDIKEDWKRFAKDLLGDLEKIVERM